MSPPPMINCLFISITAIKKLKIKRDKTIELIYILDSKKPKINSIKAIVITKSFGTKNFLKSVKDKNRENIQKIIVNITNPLNKKRE